MTTRVKYTGSTPGADSNTYVIFSSVTSFPGANFVQGAGLKRISIRFDHIYTGTVNMYRSVNRGSTWTQISSQQQSAPDTTQSSYFDVSVEAFADFKVEWVNGGTAQSPWSVDIALTAEGGPVFTFEDEIASLGAVAHFDPSWGASDTGGTATWVDRIGGYTVQGTTTRLTYSASVSGLNNRPGWTGNGTTQLLSGAAIPALASNSNTIYYVARSTSLAGAQVVCAAGSSTAQEMHYWGLQITTGAFGTRRRIAAAIDAFAGGILSPANEAFVVSCVNTAGMATEYTNAGPSMLAIAYTVGVPTALDVFSVGAVVGYTTANVAERWFTGSIGDIIIFPTAHTDAQRRYVEQLIAAKYGWPCIQGLTGFTSANYLENAGLTSGIRGSAGTGVWADVLFRPDVLPGAEQQYMASAYTAATGSIVYASATSLLGFAGNGSVGAGSPVRTLAAADIGKLGILGMTAGPGNLIRGYFNSAEIGAGTALTGYTPNASLPYRVGAVSTNASVFMSIFGVAGGNVEQVLANHQARAAAIKAAGGFVATGGATLTHAWALDSDAATIADVVGSDTLTRAGTLARAQIIVPTWPW